MKFHCFTLGCKVNQYETQAMERRLVALGNTPAPENEADALIVNTCTVTAVADRKNRTLIHRLRREHPDAVVGVCGCYAQVSTDDVAAMGVDVVSGSGGRDEFVQLLLQACRERGTAPVVAVDAALKRRDFERLPAGGLRERTRAMLKVQDGCNNFCTYCIIPYARGPVRSLPLTEAVAQAKALAEAGYREIVVRASRSPRGVGISATAAASQTSPRRCATPCRKRASASARWSRAWWTRRSAAALPRARTSARSST